MINLYDHQKRAVEKLRSGSVLCGGVGSGKSRTALMFFISKICKGKVPTTKNGVYEDVKEKVPLYIITTARKRDTLDWEKECAPFRLSTEPPSQVPVVVDSWNNIGKYKDVKDSFFIFDEQRIVGTGKWAYTFVKIAKNNRWILLSATPGDTWFDYWAIFVANGYYKNVTDFRQQHVVYKRMVKFPMIERYVGVRKLERLRDQTLIFMEFERNATRHHVWIKVGYDSESYEIVSKKRWNFEKEQPIENVSEACYLMRKVVNRDVRRSEAVLHIIETHPKVVLFYNYNYELDILRELCDELVERKVLDSYSEWNGHRHQLLPTTQKWAYLVQYTAGAEGWNCTTTNVVIFYSQNYSYKIMEQSCGRIDRINTKYTDLYYYHIFSDAPIDKAIRACLTKKKNFNENAFLNSLSR